ncbi:G8 domain-containing protein [Gemmata sp. G18]|uniref:G8 domain-containing protein n=1 Tax=Gemmata palustris TaxID=2822762 RepID=A0ABS5BJ74_9BACT|nr:G8 domain-containing protein [Gemmata palustris]MBP3953751.1 G8 domain-containing protein [Gemmata palustris]
MSAALLLALTVTLLKTGPSQSAVGADTKPAAPLVRTAASGAWSDGKTWEGGKVPGAGARVQIRTGHAVTFDVKADAVIRSIHVAGTLTFARDRDTVLNVGLIKIQPGDDASEDGFDCDAHAPNPDPSKPKPALEIGTAAEPIPAMFKATIRLHHVEGLDKETCPAVICCAGRMDLHGAPLAHTWVKLATHAKAGENTVTVPGDLSGWRAGDRVILTGTFHPDGNEKTPALTTTAQTEERVLVSVRGREERGATLKLDKPLAFEHFAEGEFRGEVANLSRNVVVESADPNGVRGHTMYHKHSAGSISYAEFRHLGKRDVLGKYPIHFHLCRDTMRGSSVVGASIWDSHNRWLTIHGTESLVVRDCVGYKSVGHGFFLEDGTETHNVLDNNLAALVLPGKALPKQMLSFDDNMGAGFWWANCKNSFTRNVAAECSEYGFAFECRRAADFDPVQPVLQADGSRKKQDVRTLPFIRFEDNECHAMPFFGMNLRGLTRPVGKIMQFAEQNKALAKEAMEAIPDVDHPFHITRLKVWDTRWPFHAGTTGVYIDGLNVYRSTYGMWRSVTDRHSYRNLKFSETSNRDIHMPLSIGMPEEEVNKGPAQGAYYTGIGGMLDDQPPHTVVTDVHPEGNLLIVRGVTADSGPVKRVTVNGRRAYSLRGEFAEWETVLERPAPGTSVTISAAAEDAGGRAERNPHKFEYRSPGAAR